MAEEKQEKKDKRATDRFLIPGATLTLRRKNMLGLLEKASDPIEIKNFTKSGISFSSEQNFKIGDTIYIEIRIPNEKTMHLVGEIRWFDDANTTIGAQFKAFGSGQNYNPLTALEKLRALQNKYS
jgi:hypothetical protein